MRNFLFCFLLSFLPLLGFGQIMEQGFDDITNMSGWTMTNQSTPVGISNWFQGNDTVFPSHSGAPTSYIGANFNNTSGAGTISNWLITPTLNLKDGDKLKFWTRTGPASTWDDRLEVRSSVGTMTVPTGGATGIGSFTNVLLVINDDYSLSYPEVWTEYEVTISGVGATPVAMNLAFRYNVVNGGPSGMYSNYIGIDTVSVEEAETGGSYCEPVLDCTDNDMITNVTFGDINNTTTCSANGYGDYTDQITSIEAEGTYPIAVTVGNGWANESVSVWIDYNNNTVFEQGEFTYIGTGSGSVVNGNIVVPATVEAGTYRMRVRVAAVGAASATWDMACDEDQGFGETEDYSVQIGGVEPGNNDDCDGAIAVSCDETVTGTTADATDSGGNAAEDRFYSYTGTGTAAMVTVSLCGSSYDTYIRVYSDCTLTNQIAFNDDECGTQSEVTFMSDGTSTYIIMVEGYSSNSGAFTLNVTCDVIDGYCEPVLDCTDNDMITNVTFQEINNDSTCSANGYGNYTDQIATAEAGQTYPISVTVGDGWAFESVSVWIDYNNNFIFEQNEFTYVGTGTAAAVTGEIAIPGTAAEGEYRMRVRVAAVGEASATWDMACDEDQGFGETEDYTISIGAVEPGDNDECDGAIAVSCGETVTGTTADATDSGGNEAADRFFSYTGTGSTETVTASLCGSAYDTYIRVFSDCTLTNEIAFNDDECGLQSEVSFTSDGTSTYIIMVEGYGTNSGDFTLNVTCDVIDGYCEPVLDCTDGDLITNVTFQEINNDSECSENGYANYTDQIANVEAEGTYSMSVTVGAGWTYESVMVWIDFNNNFVFEPSEYYFIGSDPGTTNTADITIPAGTADGQYRMRVRVGAVNPDLNDLSVMACDEDTVYGETEDYTINVGESVDPPADCFQEFTSTEVTNGVGFIRDGGGNHLIAANDFNVEAGSSFTVEKITFDVVTLGGEPTFFDVAFYEDAAGVSSQIGTTQSDITPTSITPNGEFGTTGFPVYTVEIDLPTSQTFEAVGTDAKFWAGLSAGPSADAQFVFWVSFDYIENADSEPTWQSLDAGATWFEFVAQSGSPVESIMNISGTCETLGVGEMDSFDFAYYPNPVKDVLYITSNKNVENVAVYNLAGQKVLTNAKVNNGQINVSSLETGVYVFKATLQGGQVETFKIVKK